jgi:tRNA A-37 threonylcarbamoyl transferase component Bud32
MDAPECRGHAFLAFLEIIAIEYKPGRHVARTPSEFIPVIEQLELLHSHGYVHGDIRAFNVVLAGKDDVVLAGKDEKGVPGLIDFDLGGKALKAIIKFYSMDMMLIVCRRCPAEGELTWT